MEAGSLRLLYHLLFAPSPWHTDEAGRHDHPDTQNGANQKPC